ncbi:guanylate cyclase domain-containing protein [Trichonephila clavata]|uniref:Guanylate cyclase domain-containing protein n=1 Tax=Trichonephila clavata TaxID=2740835 RepID=A0A8X6GBQ1_TRICU|nr:guanylate cyclase domain-containing protein [Trichonephila clavata]
MENIHPRPSGIAFGDFKCFFVGKKSIYYPLVVETVMDSFYSTSQCGQNKVVVSREFWKCVKEGYIYQINLLQYFPLIVEPLQDTKNKIFQDQVNFPVPSILPAALLLSSFIPSLVNFAAALGNFW